MEIEYSKFPETSEPKSEDYLEYNIEHKDQLFEQPPIKVDVGTDMKFEIIDCDLKTYLKRTRKKRFSENYKYDPFTDEENFSHYKQIKSTKIFEEQKNNSGSQERIMYRKETHEESLSEVEFNSLNITYQEENTEDLFKLSKSKNSNTLKGSRIMPLEQFIHFLDNYAKHCLQCKTKPVFFYEYQCGLFIKLIYKCYACQQNVILENSTQVFEPVLDFYAINVCSVLSSLSTGLGFAAMHEIFSMHNIIYLNQLQYKKNQLKLYEIIKKEIEISMNHYIEIEKDIAIEEGDFEGGYPTISCIGDGRWSKILIIQQIRQQVFL